MNHFEKRWSNASRDEVCRRSGSKDRLDCGDAIGIVCGNVCERVDEETLEAYFIKKVPDRGTKARDKISRKTILRCVA